MTRPDQLHQLIHSLTRSEKRYFKVYAVKGSEVEPGYLQLFDKIDKQEVYNEEKLYYELKGHTMLKNLSAAKNKLFEIVLRSLSEFHYDKTIDSRISNHLNYTRILQMKGLHAQASKHLKKAEALAERFEKFPRMLEIMELEKLMTVDMRMGNIDQGLKEIMNREHATIERLLNKSEYMEAYFETQKLYKKEKYIRSPDKLEAFESILNNPIFTDEKRALSNYSKSIFLELNALHFWNISELKSAYDLKKKQLRLWRSIDGLIDESPKAYVNFLSDFLYISYHAGHLEELKEHIQSLKQIETSDLELRLKIYVESSIFSLIYYQQQGDYDTCLTLLIDMKEELPQYEHIMNFEDKNRIYVSSSIIAFGGEDYSQALFWINKMLTEKEIDMREDIHCFARIFNLFIHFETDDGRSLEYIVQSTYRFLMKRKKLFKLEKAVIQFLKKYIHIGEKESIEDLYQWLKGEFMNINEDAVEKKFFKIFDFITWLDAKITGRKYRDLVKEKAGG